MGPLLSVTKDRIVGRLGHGNGVEEYLGQLAVPLRPDGGVLATTVLARKPTVVAEGSAGDFVPAGAAAPGIAASTYIAHPLAVRGKTVGVLVATRARGPSALGRRSAARRALLQSGERRPRAARGVG